MPLREEGSKEEGSVAQNQPFSSTYAPNYTKIDSGPYEMEHMSHVISRDGPCDLSVIPNEAT